MKHTKFIYTLLLFATLGITTACNETIDGNGNIITESREITSFEELEVSGVFEIILAEGKPGLTIECDENLLEHIHVERDGDALSISTKDVYLNSDNLVLHVTYDELEEIDLAGASELINSGIFKGKSLEIDVSGASSMKLSIDVESLEVNSSGGVEISLSGVATSASFDMSGASDIHALDLQTEECDIDISGAGEVKISVSESLEVDISGAGEVQYKGEPTIRQSISGVGELTQL